MSVRARLGAVMVATAGPAGTVVRVLRQAGPGLVGLASVSYGAWLAWPPAGWMTLGALILVDRAYARLSQRREVSI
ncbi:hypothetical protein HNP84_007334 [Thermocatellispora tengchongensis]|uniref:Uncharacterized protein n=1 Tax=Thermocatellispora tengchongensis TaxID=1073253 RepID=A0A840PEH8_9ACTN|nr:hypothetical protein [Thermocatellispora tengchongensis]MBB5137582.1 hypothetical protein [Thermocatellispora tengchongensis]